MLTNNSSLLSQIHEEEVLYNEATRMCAVSEVLNSIKEKLDRHREELSRQRINEGEQILQAMTEE